MELLQNDKQSFLHAWLHFGFTNTCSKELKASRVLDNLADRLLERKSLIYALILTQSETRCHKETDLTKMGDDHTQKSLSFNAETHT